MNQKIPGRDVAESGRQHEDTASDPGAMPFSFFWNPPDRNGDSHRQGGRPRFHLGRFPKSREVTHPEMAEHVPHRKDTPGSPSDLIAMQAKRVQALSEPSGSRLSHKTREVLAFISGLHMTPGEDARIAVHLIGLLEDFHRDVLKDLLADQRAKHGQVAAWAIDADRLMQSGALLESATLPEKRTRDWTTKIKEVVAMISRLDMEPGEDMQIALWLVRKLEEFHRYVVAELKNDRDANHDLIATWATDAERLLQSGILLESVDLD